MWAMTLGQFLPEHLLDTALIASVAGILWWLVRERSSEYRFKATVTAPIAVGSYFAAGFVIWATWPTATGLDIGMHSLWGCIFGAISGLLISRWVWKYYRREIEGDEEE